MSSDGNLLKLVFDCIWETGENIVKIFIKKEPLDVFFSKVGLCNKDKEYAKVVEKISQKDKITYKVLCPIGLGKGDFEKYLDALEIYLGTKIEIESDKGHVNIKQI